MNTYFDSQFNKKIVTIYPGEYYFGFGDEYISTVLGSCIAVALYDQNMQFGGLNHFMLAKDGLGTRENDVLAGRFGEYAMELLINEMFKMGAKKKYLTAKVFGGSNVLCSDAGTQAEQVGEVNIKFAFDYLNREGIPIISSDTGGNNPRKIFYDPASSKIWQKKLRNTIHESEYIKKKESEYIAQQQRKEEKAGDIIWF